MKIFPIMQFIFLVVLLSAGLVSLARWFHPALFPLTSLWLLLIAAFVSAAVIISTND